MRYRRTPGLCFALFREQLKMEWKTPRVWMGYLFGICIILMRTRNYMEYSGNNAIQICEPFILMMNDYTYSMFVFLGLLLVLVDSPFINGRSIYTAVRGSRKTWYFAMIFYVIFQVCFYFLLLFGATAIFCARGAYLKNVWSQSFYILGTFQPLEALTEWGLSFSGTDIIRYVTPLQTFALTYLLNVCYGISLLLLAFLINMNGRWVLGNVVAILVHLAGIALIKSVYVGLWMRFSPLAYAQLVFFSVNEKGFPTLFRAWTFFGIFLGLEILAGGFLVRKMDFVTARGDKEL